MNKQPPTIADLVAHLSSLLPSIPVPSSSNSLSILPHSIPPLPNTSSTLPASPLSLEGLQSYLSTHILPYLNSSSLSPNYYGFVTGGATPAALLADWLVSIYDQNLSVHLPRDTIATTIEVAALNQLVDLFHLPREQWGVGSSSDGGGATFTTGATASNILGLAVAREWTLSRAALRKTGQEMSASQHGLYETMIAAEVRKIQVLSTLPHSSVGKACSVLGIGREHVFNVVKEGTEMEIDIKKVSRYGMQKGTVSVLVVSTGEVNTGRFATTGMEGWRELRKLCDAMGIWIHVDGAFGLFGRALMGEHEEGVEEIIRGVEGLELADSITGDGHKLLNVPYDCGFFFTRHNEVSETVFSNGNAAYLKSWAGDGIQSPLNIGIENSRRFRALPVHATLISYGREGYVDMLKRQIGLTRRVVKWLLRDERFEVLPIANEEREAVAKTFMVVLFRAKDEEFNKNLIKKINASEKMFVTGTSWEGQPAARIAVSNWQADIERDGKLIEAVLNTVATESM